MQTEQKSERVRFCEEYVECIMERVFETKAWGVADILLQQCPRHYLTDVGFLFLHHFIAASGAKKEDHN